MPNTIDAITATQPGHPDHAEEDRLPDSPLASELHRARRAENGEAVRRRRADARRQRGPHDREQRVPVGERGDHASDTDAAGATGPWRARFAKSQAEPARISADTTTGPAAPVPKMRVTP